MKRVAISLCLFASALAAQTLSITSTSGASTLTAKPGDAVALAITSDALAGAVGLQWTVSSPAGWPAPTQAIGPMGAGSQKTLACFSSCILYGWFGGVGNKVPVANGPVAIVTTTVPSSAAAGDYKFTLNPVYSATWDGQDAGVVPGAPLVVTVTIPPPPTFSRYDLNHDGLVNGADVGAVVDQATGKVACTTGDVNGDGVCNTRDVALVIAASSGDIPK